MRPRLLALLLLCGLADAHPHNSPSIWVNFEVGESEVQCIVVIRRDLLGPWLGDELTSKAISDIEKALGEEDRRRVLVAARDYLAKTNSVEIDGRVVDPVARSAEEPENLYGTDRLEYLEMKFAYPCTESPQKVALAWHAYEGAKWENQTVVPSLLSVGKEVEVISFSPEEPGYIWHGTVRSKRVRPEPVAAEPPAKLRVRVLTILFGLLAIGWLMLRGVDLGFRFVGFLAAAVVAAVSWNTGVLEFYAPWSDVVAVPPGEQAEKIFDRLHRNVYEAFGGGTEDEILDLLEVSVDAEILDDLYADIYESLILREEGGAVTKVDRVEVFARHVELPPEEERDTWPPRFEVDWSWRVYCSVTHWGHTHNRVNEYVARYKVKHDGRSWKIEGMDVKDHKRLELDLPEESSDGMEEFK